MSKKKEEKKSKKHTLTEGGDLGDIPVVRKRRGKLKPASLTEAEGLGLPPTAERALRIKKKHGRKHEGKDDPKP